MEITNPIEYKVYPQWWEGRRFDRPVNAWAIGITSNSTRDVLQYELLGLKNAKLLDNKDFDDYQMGVLGSGSIPRYCIAENMTRDGDRILQARIKHHKDGVFNGYSILEFKSTQQGHNVLAGVSQSLIWLDESDPYQEWDIWEQCLTRTTTPKGSIIITATPENGKTKLITHFMNSEDKDFHFQMASVYEAHESIGGHLSDRDIEVLAAGVAPHKLRMRLYGEPMQGSGLVWDMDLSKVTCAPFDIPDSWERVCALDIGNAHRTAITFSAYDKNNDTIYIYYEAGDSGKTPAHYASLIRKRDKDIPVILPRDAWQDRGNGQVFYETYKAEMLNVQPDEFYNKLTLDNKKDFSVEYGIEEMRVRMLEGRLKIFTTCEELLKEMASYHRKLTDTGVSRIVKENDDFCDSARYSVMSLLANRGQPRTGSKWSDVSNLNYWGRH